ncbi:MAG: hypothetical protein R2695_17830 [Acidimicrobiales bacterium]
MTVTIESRPASSRVDLRWIRHPGWDVGMALAWVPFAALALQWSGDPSRLRWLVAATLLFSVSHQPLTLPLVYADPHVVRSRPRVFGFSPVVFVALVLLGLQLDPVVIAVIAGVWNAGHTLQQRYGITRIYGRKVGQSDGRTEHQLLWAMLVLALVVAAADADTPSRIASAGLGGRNQKGLDVLTEAAPVARHLVPVMIAVVALLLFRWVRQERALARVNPAKWVYLAPTTALIGLTMVSPLAGFVGYVGSHAAEYYLIVHNHLADRYPDAITDGGAPLGRAVRSAIGPSG